MHRLNPRPREIFEERQRAFKRQIGVQGREKKRGEAAEPQVDLLIAKQSSRSGSPLRGRSPPKSNSGAAEKLPSSGSCTEGSVNERRWCGQETSGFPDRGVGL